MSKLIMDNYYQDGLTKRECTECGLEFIVGTDLSKECKTIGCPYCGARGEYATESVAEMNEADGSFYELGCMGIYYDLTPCEEDIEIEDCVKSIQVNPETGEVEIEFKDEQTPEETECIRQFVLELAEKSTYDVITE